MCVEPLQSPIEASASQHHASWSEEQPNDLSGASLRSGHQTCIIFDWDDTIFPLTYVILDLRLNPHVSLQEQAIPEAMKKDVSLRLARCAEQAKQLLTLAASMGKVTLITLSQDSWIVESCRNFCPELHEVIHSLGLSVLYAQSDLPKGGLSISSSRPSQDDKWTELKAKAIEQCLAEFCAEENNCCEGDSVHVLSIGDSEFERLGTQRAVHALTRSQACKASQVYTKTFKTMEKPTVEELTSQLAHLVGWLPLMVSAREALDLRLPDVDDRYCFQDVDQKLRRAAGLSNDC